MTKADSTCLWQVQEPKKRYSSKPQPLAVRAATVHKQVYLHPVKTNPSGSGRSIPWINLRGFWLERAGFRAGTKYTIEVYEGKLVLVVAD